MSPPDPLALLSVVIPARDEEESLPATLRAIADTFGRAGVPHEIVVVDDGTQDRTWTVLAELQREIPTLAPTRNASGAHGFGRPGVRRPRHTCGTGPSSLPADSPSGPDASVQCWHPAH